MNVPESGHADAHSCGALQVQDSQLLPCSGSRPLGRPLHGLKEGLNLNNKNSTVGRWSVESLYVEV